MNDSASPTYPCHHNSLSPEYHFEDREYLKENVLLNLPYFTGTNNRCAYCAYERGWSDSLRAVLHVLQDLHEDIKHSPRRTVLNTYRELMEEINAKQKT